MISSVFATKIKTAVSNAISPAVRVIINIYCMGREEKQHDRHIPSF